MDGESFFALAPRQGNKPLLGSSDIGVCRMNGGAFNWGSIWSGLKSFGSNVKNWGSKAWNSNSGQALRNKLKETKVQEKIIDGINTGIHGAIDIAQQELNKAIEKRLDKPTIIPEQAQIEEIVPEEKIEVDLPLKGKRPREEEDIIVTSEGPPTYEEIFGNKSTPSASTYPMTRPHPSMAKPVMPPKPVSKPSPAPAVIPPPPIPPVVHRRPVRNMGWQSTLNNIVGMGVRVNKRRRCF
ncbi:pVI [California sea lion adenovirus 1]|uniref:Pre-protein VI n=1 Tax=California sea lion adenovirus 1 TaxID=943083 RepID=A0A059XIF1_9ADEN|nr:pVI [California sea lion adenovirus 1]AIA22356.1 pVI [California sea lion adenovirus 1]